MLKRTPVFEVLRINPLHCKAKAHRVDIIQPHDLALALRKLPVEGGVEEGGMETDEVFIDIESFFSRTFGDDYRNELLGLSVILS